MKTLLFILASLFVAASVSAQSRGNIGTTSTVATLTNSVPTSTLGGVVATLGRVTAGDGDGAVYEWDSSSAAAVDNVLVLPSALSGTGRWLLSIGSGAGGGATVADGNKGDVLVSGSGATWTVNPAAIAYSKIQDVAAASRFLGRGSASGAGPVQEITAGSGLVFTGTTVSVDTPVSSGDKGDITVSTPGGGSFGLTIDNQAVTYGQIQNITNASRLLGRGSSGGTGPVQEITTGSGLTFSGTAVSVTTPLFDDDKGDITVGSGGTTFIVDSGAISYGKIQPASENRLIGRGNGSGAGSVQEITLGTGLSLSGTVLSASGADVDEVFVVASVAEISAIATAATSTNDVAKAIFTRGYWASYQGVGAGIWRYDPDSRRPASRSSIFVGSTGQYGRYHPVFVSGRINVEQLGAVDGLLDSYATDDAAFTNAWALQQDPNWNDKTLFVPSGEFQISSSISQYHQGTITTNYTVNGAHATNSTAITIQNGGGSYLPGSSITFSGSTRKHMVVSHNGSTALVIQEPGLTVALTGGESITINTPIRPIVSGVARAGSYGNYREGSTIIMTTTTSPVFEVGYEEGLIEKLNIRYGVNGSSSLAYATDPNAAGILSLSGKNVYRYIFRDLAFRGCSRGFYFPASGGTTSPNNSFENIWIMSGSIGAMHFGKSGTINRFSNIYVQNNGNVPSGNLDAIISGISGSGTSTMTLSLTNSIYLMTAGSYIQTDNIGSSGGTADANSVFFVTSLSGTGTSTQITVDAPSGQTFGTLSLASNSKVSSKARAGNSEALVVLGQNFMCTFDALDIEATRGPAAGAAAGTPALLDNTGQAIIDYFHGENVQLQDSGYSMIRNNGGTLRIGQASLLNIGMTQNTTNYFFYNERPSTVQAGQFVVESVSIRDISNIPTSPGLFVLAEKSAANGGASAVVIDNYIPMPTVRSNAKSVWPVGVANTRAKTSGAQLGYTVNLPSTGLLEPIYHYGLFDDTSNYRRSSFAQDANGLLVIDSNGLGSLYATNNSIEIRVNGTNRLGISKSGSVSISNGSLLRLGSGASAGASLNATTDGAVLMQNFAGGDFGRLQFGGTDTNFPAIKRSGATLQAVLANDTGFAPVQSLYIRFGAGTPEGSVTAPIGALYSRTDGGALTSLYVKESGTGNTGWVPK